MFLGAFGPLRGVFLRCALSGKGPSQVSIYREAHPFLPVHSRHRAVNHGTFSPNKAAGGNGSIAFCFHVDSFSLAVASSAAFDLLGSPPCFGKFFSKDERHGAQHQHSKAAE